MFAKQFLDPVQFRAIPVGDGHFDFDGALDVADGSADAFGEGSAGLAGGEDFEGEGDAGGKGKGWLVKRQKG